MGGPSACGLGLGLTTPHRKINCITKCHKMPRTWTYYLNKRPKLRKMDIRFRTWNIDVYIGQVRS
jgi:hypothetical protein